MKTFQRFFVLCLLVWAFAAGAAAGEAIGVVVDREVDGARATSVCVVTLEGEAGPCFIENMPPAEFVWETIKYHASGRFLLAEKQNPPELWGFGNNGKSGKIAESANWIAEYTMADTGPVVYYNPIDEKFETHVYRADFTNADENEQPSLKECPGKLPDGLAFDTANQRVIFFAMSDDMMSKNLVAYDPACEKELVRFALPDDITANTVTAVLSPDGNSVIYLGFTMGADMKSGLYMTDITTKETVNLLEAHGEALGEGQAVIFSFSPDGKSIAMIFFTNDVKKHLYIVSSDGKSLVKAESDDIETFRGEQPVWHPSGEFVTATAMIKGGGNSDVFAFTPGGELTNLTVEDPSFKFAQSISSDGAFMAYIFGYGQKLMLYDLAGRKLLGAYPEPGSYAFPKWIAYGK